MVSSTARSRAGRDPQRQQHHDPLHYSASFTYRQSAGIRKGPLWISAGILILVPLVILNIQLWLYQDPSLQGDAWVESQHWRPPSRILGETPVAKCIQWETTGQLIWVQRDLVQIVVVDAHDQWWFLRDQKQSSSLWSTSSIMNNTTTTKLNLFQGPILWPPPSNPQQQQSSPSGTADLYHFASLGGDDISPWYAAQRVVREALGIPSSLLRIQDYDGMRTGHVPPIARDHWLFLGRVPLMHLDENDIVHLTGELSGYLYTYVWIMQQPQPDDTMNSIVTALNVEQVMIAMTQQRFVGMHALTSLAMALAHANTGWTGRGRTDRFGKPGTNK